nr:hypothetical protein [Mycobacterium eburneum]
MPSPLTDELSPEAKAELAVTFAAMRAWFDRLDKPRVQRRARRQPWELGRAGW